MSNAKEKADVGERFGIQWDASILSRDGSELTHSAEEATGIPFEPPARDGFEPDSKAIELKLRNQYLNPLPLAGDVLPVLRPALLHGYADMSHLRHDYPVVFPKSGGVNTLTEIIDRITDGLAEEGDAADKARVRIQQVEAQIRKLLMEEDRGHLLELWDRASDDVMSARRARTDTKNGHPPDLADARAQLPDGELFPCCGEVAERTLRGIALQEWQARCATWRSDFAMLLTGLRDIIDAEFTQSPEGTSAEHLRSSIGHEESFDVDAMSRLLRESDLGAPLPESRRKRIAGSIAAMERVAPLFADDIETLVAIDDPLLRVDTVVGTHAAAIDLVNARMPIMVAFFQAARIARLEIANRYRESIHDPYFLNFDESQLTDEERAVLPPALLRVAPDAESDAGDLIGLLTSRLPAKILLELASLADTQAMPTWQARLAATATTLADAYCMQTPISNFTMLRQCMADGLAYDGPALFAIYVGSTAQNELPTYLDAASATESRVLPSFSFNPARGDTWLERMYLDGNPTPAEDWAVGTFGFRDVDGNNTSADIPFTPADFMLTDSRFRGHYAALEPTEHIDCLTPLHEFLRMDGESQAQSVPYITGVDSDDRVCRITVSRHIATATARTLRFWKSLRELGGVGNSFEARAMQEEKQRLEAEKDQEIARLEETYRTALERDVGELTKEIVQRIARQLVNGAALDASSDTLPAAPGRRAEPAPTEAPEAPPATEDGAEAEAPAAPSAAPEAADDEDDDVVTLDDPYIDTPLCTSCNECTQLNGRMFAYNENKQAFIQDATAGTFNELVRAAEACPVKIIHPGKPKNPDEPGLDDLIARAAPFN